MLAAVGHVVVSVQVVRKREGEKERERRERGKTWRYVYRPKKESSHNLRERTQVRRRMTCSAVVHGDFWCVCVCVCVCVYSN